MEERISAPVNPQAHRYAQVALVPLPGGGFARDVPWRSRTVNVLACQTSSNYKAVFSDHKTNETSFLSTRTFSNLILTLHIYLYLHIYTNILHYHILLLIFQRMSVRFLAFVLTWSRSPEHGLRDLCSMPN